MVQILDYVPSFLEQIVPDVNKLAGGISAGIGQRYRNKADASILEQLQSGQISPANYPTLWAKLSPEARKTYEPFLQSAIRQQESTSKENLKRETADLEKAEKSNAVLDSAQGMRDLIEYTGSTRIPFTKSAGAREDSFVNREGLQKRNKFDALAASAASFFRDLDTKGQLPQGLYEQVIKPNLPNSKLSERANLGKIEGLEDLARTYGGKTFKQGSKETKNAEKSPEKVKAGTKLTDEIAIDLLKKSGNDKAKARELAREMGYEF